MLLKLLLVCSLGHKHVVDVLKVVDELGRVATTNGQANNRHETESVATANPSISIAPVRSHGWHATTSPSTSAAPIIRGRGWRAATLRVVTSPQIPAPIPYVSP